VKTESWITRRVRNRSFLGENSGEKGDEVIPNPGEDIPEEAR
jgi:hypothetical protein